MARIYYCFSVVHSIRFSHEQAEAAAAIHACGAHLPPQFLSYLAFVETDHATWKSTVFSAGPTVQHLLVLNSQFYGVFFCSRPSRNELDRYELARRDRDGEDLPRFKFRVLAWLLSSCGMHERAPGAPVAALLEWIQILAWLKSVL